MELDWALPQKKQQPLYISYNPHPVDLSQNFLNPFLGYPNCPIIGRYNRGQYRIGETLFQLQFKCKYNADLKAYQCGGKKIQLPQLMHDNIRNIPQVIINNKAAALKSSPQILPQRYPVRQDLSVYWVVSFGELGKDFLNYLNHMYILACTLFLEEKLQRMIHYLPIYAFLPENSGLKNQQVEKGLNFKNYRGQYMSFHLNKGAPAFSPNNMRLGVEGGKLITSKQPKQAKKQKQKPKYIQKEKAEQLRKKKQAEKDKQDKQQQQFNIDWKEMQGELNIQQKEKIQKKNQQQTKKQKQQNIQQPYIHFYTSLLLEEDYRIYYHWHIQDITKQDLIKDILKQSFSVEQFLQKYKNFVGIDPMVRQVSRFLFPNIN